MELLDLIVRDAVAASVKVASKRHLLQDLATRAGEVYGLDPRAVFDGLTARERLGSTAMGAGVAIPHARLPGLDRIVALFARLDRPVDFEAADGQGVDLVFVLLAPETAGAEHLRALARVSRLLRDAEIRAKLRATDEGKALYALLTEPANSRAA